MRRLGAIFLILVVLSAGLHNLMIQAIFNINQVRIARTICVEKDIKDSNCGGCCQLKKSLAKENTDEGTIPTEQKQSEIVFQAITENQTYKLPKFLRERQSLWPFEKSAIDNGFLSSVYHPPEYV